MRQTRKLSAFLLLLLITLCCSSRAFTQVIAGIRANGQVVNDGDTVRVCEGSNITWLSSAQGSLNISWAFTGGNKTAANGIGPFQLNYPTAGFYNTKQVITGGNMADSMFITVHVSNTKPTAGYSFTPN